MAAMGGAAAAFDPASIPQMEAAANASAVGGVDAYDLDSNLALLRLYAMYPDKLNVRRAARARARERACRGGAGVPDGPSARARPPLALTRVHAHGPRSPATVRPRTRLPTQIPVAANVLVKALMALPGPDFKLCQGMLPARVMRQEPFATLAQLSGCLGA